MCVRIYIFTHVNMYIAGHIYTCISCHTDESVTTLTKVFVRVADVHAVGVH